MLFTKPTVSLLFSLSLFASVPPACSAVAQNFPILPRTANQSATNVSPANGTQKYFAASLCNARQKANEQIDWEDARRYAQALASWRPNGSFQPAMDLYMGTDSRGPLSQVLEANIDGALSVHNLSTWPARHRLFVFCDEPALVKEFYTTAGGGCEALWIAYVFNVVGIYYDNHYIVFCPLYWDLPSLSQVISKVDEGLASSDVLDNFTWHRGRVYFHESMHFDNLTTAVGHPVDDSYLNESSVYGPSLVAEEAKQENTAATIHIADAYSCAAAAIFAQQRFNLTDPPLPRGNVARGLGPRPRSYHSRNGGWNAPALTSQLPNPNTPDNRIIFNNFGIGPIAPITQDSPEVSFSRHLVPGSSSLLKRMAWRPEFRCTPENGCMRSKAATIATTISGPLICFLVVGLCVLSFSL